MLGTRLRPGSRTTICRPATNRGMTVKILEGDGFVAVRKVDELRARKGRAAPLVKDSDDLMRR
jgi:hypothetical protein